MRTICIGIATLLLAACGNGDGAPVALLAPTFDATGTWVARATGSFTSPPGNEELDSAALVMVTQTGNNVTVDVVGDTVSYSGTVSGASYAVGATLPEPGGGSTDEMIEFTLASADAGNGMLRWTFTGPGGPVSGGSDLALARATAPLFDMTGTWNVTTSGNFSDPAGNEEADGTVSVAVTQTGSTVEMMLDGALRTGFVSGADYYVEYDTTGGGGADICIVVQFTLGSATDGAGTRRWRSENGVIINGGANLALVKP